jgi:sugar lactone lactonase YvrE
MLRETRFEALSQRASRAFGRGALVSLGLAAVVLAATSGTVAASEAPTAAPVPEECQNPNLSAAEQARCDFIARTPDLCLRSGLSEETQRFCDELGEPRPYGWETTILVEGAPLKGGSNGLAFDSTDALYIANIFGVTISVIDPDTGELLDQLGAEQGVVAVDDLDFAPDGSLFWTDALGTVSRRSPGRDGIVSSEDGTTTLVVADIPAANPITITDDGRVFVAQCYAPETGVFEIIDPYGATPSPLRTVLDGIPGCASNGMDHTNGTLFTPRWFEDRILAIDDQTGATVKEIVTDHVPTAVKLHNGFLYWVSQETGGVYRADLAETSPVPQLFAQLKPGLDNLAFDSQGRLFVSHGEDGSIVEIMDDASVRIVSEGGLTIPKGIAVVGDTVYTGNPAAVLGFDRRTGELVSEIISVFAIGPLTDVRGVFADGEHLILTSWFSGTIQIVDPVTEEIITDAHFEGGPFGATRFQGDLVVAEGFAGQVTRATGPNLEDREVIAQVPGAVGLAATRDDLYVTSQTEGEVLQIVRDGVVLTTPAVIATGLQGPEGIAVMSHNRLAVVEVGTGSLKEIDLRSGRIKTIASDLGFVQIQPELFLALWFNGVAIDRQGDLYVNGDAANVIYKISR